MKIPADPFGDRCPRMERKKKEKKKKRRNETDDRTGQMSVPSPTGSVPQPALETNSLATGRSSVSLSFIYRPVHGFLDEKETDVDSKK